MKFLYNYRYNKMLVKAALVVVLCVGSTCTDRSAINCRERSAHLRLDGGQCFEIPDWHHEPVQLEDHLKRLKDLWGTENLRRKIASEGGAPHAILSNSEVSRYMDTVLAPFLDTYHRNIQNSYQQMAQKIAKKIKHEISQALVKKKKTYENLAKLADKLKIPAMCDEERRYIKTISSGHVALVYACTENARTTVAKMGKYAEEMIMLTRNHMQATLDDATKVLRDCWQGRDGNNSDLAPCLAGLSQAAVSLGYELDLSLTYARRHNEQSCERLSNCGSRARRLSEDNVAIMRDKLYQCVYA